LGFCSASTQAQGEELKRGRQSPTISIGIVQIAQPCVSPGAQALRVSSFPSRHPVNRNLDAVGERLQCIGVIEKISCR
jgi:hypothetical protein